MLLLILWFLILHFNSTFNFVDNLINEKKCSTNIGWKFKIYNIVNVVFFNTHKINSKFTIWHKRLLNWNENCLKNIFCANLKLSSHSDFSFILMCSRSSEFSDVNNLTCLTNISLYFCIDATKTMSWSKHTYVCNLPEVLELCPFYQKDKNTYNQSNTHT